MQEAMPRKAERISTLAAEIDVSTKLIINWVKAGRLPAFRIPGSAPGPGTRGPKGLRIWRDDWDRFCRANTKVERPAEELRVIPTGTDGKSRLRRGNSQGLPTGTDGISRLRSNRRG